jgi:DNA-directed RNA polymerase subunit alpha
MAILNFQKPDKIILQKATDFEAQFEFRPLEPGYGVTIGNALRRVLLNSLEGYAIVGVKIEGVEHEFATLKGVSEDVVEIFLNLKQVRFKKKGDQDVAQDKIHLTIKNKTEFTAGMIGDASASFQVIATVVRLSESAPARRSAWFIRVGTARITLSFMKAVAMTRDGNGPQTPSVHSISVSPAFRRWGAARST